MDAPGSATSGPPIGREREKIVSMQQPFSRFARLCCVGLVGLVLATTSPASALQNEGGGDGGRSKQDILADGYRCIAQDPHTGNLWCVRGQGEPGYVCLPSGTCYPVGPGTRPPWVGMRKFGPGSIAKPAGGLTRSLGQ